MARQYADDFQDHVQVIKLALENAEAAAKATLEAFDNIAFWLQDAIMVVTTLTSGVLLAGIEYLEENVNDPDALRLAAEQFYCAIIATYGDDPQFGDLFSNINYPLDFTPPSLSLDEETGEWIWENLSDLVDFVVGIGTGESAGWGILAWAQIHNELMPAFVQPLFISNPYEAMIKLVLNNSNVFAVENCIDFCGAGEWTQEFDFTLGELGWSAIVSGDEGAPYGVWDSAGWNSAFDIFDAGHTELRLEYIGAEFGTLTDIEIHFTTSGGGTFSLFYSSTSFDIVFSGASPYTLIDETGSILTNFAHLAFYLESQDSPVVFTYLKLSGTGENPFE
jgi:hypothetical protein